MPRVAALALAVALAAASAGCSGVSEKTPVRYIPVSFADLPDWPGADPRPALEAFRKSCSAANAAGAHAHSTSLSGAPLPVDAATLLTAWKAVCTAAAFAETPDASSARVFFERHFTPHRVLGPDGPQGLFTGYYEPVLRAARRKRDGYSVPIHAKPAETKDGVILANRAEIETSAPANWPVLFWAADPVDVFTLHVQGSGRLELAEGGYARVGYAGNNGHGYVAIGRLMRERGLLPADGVNMPAIQAWLRANPDAGRALMQENPRYIFFREVPDREGTRGQQGVPLTEMASLAVDPAFIPMGLPLWLVTNWPAEKEKPLRELVVAQDTGAAIKGSVRGDIFFGSGRLAPHYAGHMAERGSYYLLLPRR